ncbi:MAG: NADPH-dependent reductase [Firmicutes bacterium]|nr:NADPH-dependent reductase [Bacillota bacterium]
MKIVAINGSHRGRNGNTAIMVNAFLAGAKEGGAETVDIVLAEKEIRFCTGCKACWFKTPGCCVLEDDMQEILALSQGADVRVLATPLYFDTFSSLLKVFIDRLIVTASPFWSKDKEGECRHQTKEKVPKLMVISNCGYPERTHFQVLSHWLKRHARNLNTEILGEIYASQGALLSLESEEVRPAISSFLRAVETAGKEVASSMRLTEKTEKLLEQPFITNEVYIQEVRRYVTGLLEKQI